MEQGIDVAVAAAQAAIAARRAAEHELHAAVARLEAEGTAAAGGYRSTAALLRDALRVDPVESRRLVERAGQVIGRRSTTGEPLEPALPAAAAAGEAGVIGEGHLAVIADTVEHLRDVPGLDADALAEAEVTLAGHAATLAPCGLRTVAQRLVNTLDPDGAAPDDGPTPVDELHVVRRRDGSLALKGRIRSAADAELIAEVFDALGIPAGPDDPRSRAERDAAVLVELCGRAASPTGVATDTREQGAGCATVTVSGRALLAVTMDHRWLQRQVGHGLLDSGCPLAPGAARRLACDAGVVPMVLGTRSEPLDVGRLSYTVPEGLRRALHLRDGGCSFPGCTRRPKRCHAHHIDHWLDGGPTELRNLTLLCLFHHQLVHVGGWTVKIVDGRPWWWPPSWIDPQRTPRPGGRFPVPDRTPAP